MDHLTKTMAVELGPAGIRVLAVASRVRRRPNTSGLPCPPEYLDAVALSSTPLQRHCTPEDSANLILLMVSQMTRPTVTGQLVLADMGAHIALNRPASVRTTNDPASTDVV